MNADHAGDSLPVGAAFGMLQLLFFVLGVLHQTTRPLPCCRQRVPESWIAAIGVNDSGFVTLTGEKKEDRDLFLEV